MADSKPHDLTDFLKRQMALRAAVAKDPRYPLDAYLFVCEAVDFTCEKLGKRRDVTGRELIEGLCDLALEYYGFLAPTVLERWNITRTDDFGTIVFTLVGVGLLGKSPRDKMADFENLFNLRETLCQRYRIDEDPEI